ncbi:hypothetical protein PHMEG_00018409 [Phytophthora megakarya]|uniref:RxLR effector protein n=1 Tax=Phytophthora megakarya TaxID=4795 RepID=A0A225VU36_9STRA|nr:hypothetical protein PHMEG_00018409 [Phytophthora megakarya]
MIFSSIFTVLALVFLSTFEVTSAGLNTPRHLRIEAPHDNIANLPTRNLQPKFPWAAWVAIIKTNLRYQPTDRLYDHLRQVKEKLQRNDG